MHFYETDSYNANHSGGKLSHVQLHALLVIRRKSFAIVWPAPYYKKKEFTGKLSRLQANPQKVWKFFTMNDLHYIV